MDNYDSNYNDPYCYPNSSVLKNKLGIRDQKDLELKERSIALSASTSIRISKPPYTLKSLIDIHRKLFNTLYPWAGEIRILNIGKNGTGFCPPTNIISFANIVFKDLQKDNNLIGLKRQDFISKLAYYYAELNMLHPFREGNGRTQRILFEHIAFNADYELDWDTIGREEWLSANVISVLQDERALVDIFNSVVI